MNPSEFFPTVACKTNKNLFHKDTHNHTISYFLQIRKEEVDC